jgi:hypothetical protein
MVGLHQRRNGGRMARKQVQLPVLVEEAMAQRIRELAKEKGVSIAAVVRWALTDYFLPAASENGSTPKTDQPLKQQSRR